ncbi:MAG: DUF1194 domain-containing protein [Pseudomonadota bacterium]
MKLKSILAAGIASVGLTTAANAVDVDVELLLLSDSSGSINTSDFDLYMDGYAAAFRDSDLTNAIADGVFGSIAVSLAFFSDAGQQVQSIGWTLIDSVATANAFADAIDAVTRPFSSSTGIARGLDFGAGLFANNNFDGTRNVIDLVADGSESVDCNFRSAVCAPVQAARDNALAGDVDVINALLVEDDPFFGDDLSDDILAVPYAQNNIIGGPDSFAILVSGFSEFEPAITSKLTREIAPPSPTLPSVPLPASLPMLAAGAGALAIMARRRKLAS